MTSYRTLTTSRTATATPAADGTRPRTRRVAGTFALVATAGLTLAACTDNTASTEEAGGGEGHLQVTSTADACEVSATEAPSGQITFTVKNSGSEVTEFYLLAEDGVRIIGEVENIAPGLSRDLVLTAAPGSYKTACKPGMVGAGIQNDFTVTDSGAEVGPSGDDKKFVQQANAQYAAYVKNETEQLLEGTQAFAAAYKAGDDEKARALYPRTRVHWERIETVAESFGDLDPQMDAREADVEEGTAWTGWHVAEKDLWAPDKKANGGTKYEPLTDDERAKIADKLVKDTQTLHDRTRKMDFTADQISNGAKGLLDEVATGKVTGEEEIWSHTDLYDFQANVDGAKVAYENLKPLLEKKDPELSGTIGKRFDALQALLDEHRQGKDGFASYTDLSEADVKKLSDAVNALSEPLSQMTPAVLK